MKWTIRSIFPKKRSKGTSPESSDVPSKPSHINNNHDDHDTNLKQSSCQGGAVSSADLGVGIGSSFRQNGTNKNRDTMIVHNEPEAYDPRTIREIIQVQQRLNKNDDKTGESKEGKQQSLGPDTSELVTTPLKPRPQSDTGAPRRKYKRSGSESSFGSTKCIERPEAQHHYSSGVSREPKCGHEPRTTPDCMNNQPHGSIANVRTCGNSGSGNGGRNNVGGNSGTVRPIESEDIGINLQGIHPRRVGRSIYGKGNPYLLCGSPLLKLNDMTHNSPSAFEDGRSGDAPDADATELITRPIRFETDSECRDRLEKRVASALSSARPMKTTPLESQSSKAPYSTPSLTAFGRKTHLSGTIPLSPCPSSSESDEPDTESSTIDKRTRKGRQGQWHHRRHHRRSNNNHEHTLSAHDDEFSELVSIRYRSHAQEPLSEPIYGRPMAGFSTFNIGHSTDHTLSPDQKNLSRRGQDDCLMGTEGCSWLEERTMARTRDLYNKDFEQYMQDHATSYGDHSDGDVQRKEIYKQACKFAEMMAEARRLAMQSAPLNEQFIITFEQISESSGDDQPKGSKGKGSFTAPAMEAEGHAAQLHTPTSSRTSQASSVPVPTRMKRRQQRQSLPTFITRGTATVDPSLVTVTSPRRHSNNTSRCTARRIIYTDELERGLPKGHIARENHYEIVQSPREPCGAGVGIGYPNRLSIAPIGSTTIVIRPGGATLSSVATSRPIVPGTVLEMDRTRSSAKNGECLSSEDPRAGK
ncbi:hypothetical protein BGX34_000343 [Mortierella sp. NVP85]|nr:hypothetical protein BGX34_000343 [Mortierella sp. NVP85]